VFGQLIVQKNKQISLGLKGSVSARENKDCSVEAALAIAMLLRRRGKEKVKSETHREDENCELKDS